MLKVVEPCREDAKAARQKKERCRLPHMVWHTVHYTNPGGAIHITVYGNGALEVLLATTYMATTYMATCNKWALKFKCAPMIFELG